MKHTLQLKKGILLLMLGLFFTLYSNAAPKYNMPVKVTQPDGTVIACFASGDEFHNWLHDSEGYTIIQHPKTGYYVYAVEINGDLSASEYVVGKVKPSATKSLKPNANISKERYAQRRARMKVNNHFIDISESKVANGIRPISTNADVTMNNVVIFIKFADDAPATEAVSYYETVYNNTTESVKDYYSKVSYNKFTVNSTFYPAPTGGNVVWYTDTQNRNYYRPYNAATNLIGYDPNITGSTNTSGKTYREHTLLKNAVNAVSAAIPVGLDLDINGDGYVDVVSFIVAGTNDTWNDLLWPHQWSLYSQTASINGKQVGDYTFQIQFFGSNRIDLGTLCHEMFHAVGAPDLYHYDDAVTVDAVGVWDVMERTLDVPQNMGAYMKYLYGGWISSIPQINQTGTYTLSPLSTSSTQNVYMIPSPNSYQEYFVVEYRKREGYDSGLPSDGMLVYRINSLYEGIGNADGPPDEVYIYRPGGTTTVNGTLNSATFNSAYSRTAINDQTNPSSFLNDGSAGGLKISNVTTAGSAISFDVAIDFLPYVVLRNDKGLASGIGTGGEAEFTVASKYTASELTSLVGRKIVKVDFYLNGSNGVDVTNNETVKIWEVIAGTTPALISTTYSQNEPAALFDAWTSHTLSQPLEIKSNKDYWVGYTVTTTAGYPLATDAGPMVSGKGAWIYSGGSWKQLTELNASLNYNFLIRAIIGSAPTDVETFAQDTFKVGIYPNPISTEGNFKFNLPKAGTVSVDIYNMLGQRVGGFEPIRFEEGENIIPFSKNDLSSGVYLYTVNFSDGKNQLKKTQKLIISR